ncbi:MAG: hypothetical protein EXS00_05965 [Phycisphaerales bacterium]|nr:hypothetical protein [Phycisphaerales bacterium]
METRRQLFNIDPGWCYLIAGLALLVCAAVVPEQAKVHRLREELAALKSVEASGYRRLQAYAEFADDVEAGEPALLRRLAASQLNLMPGGTTPVLMATSIDSTVTDWVEATLPESNFAYMPFADSLLARWVLGPSKLWLIALGAFCLFVGLMMGNGTTKSALGVRAA